MQLSKWLLMFQMTPRDNVAAFSTNPFEGFVSFDRIPRRDLRVAILSNTISERDC